MCCHEQPFGDLEGPLMVLALKFRHPGPRSPSRIVAGIETAIVMMQKTFLLRSRPYKVCGILKGLALYIHWG
jgi:hypothetical protein